MAATTKPVYYNTSKWIEENKQFFLPPVCNKMMHNDGQMKLFFVGGPNQRKDFHVDCGEEFFYQLKGDMVLKVIERGQHRDIHIREGEIFLLPGRIHHSPQRFENTIGLVLERARHQDTEKDGVRYFIENNDELTTDVLYEKWFWCTDLGTELGPLIKQYFASEQHKTGKPIPGTILENPPVELDNDRVLEEPFNFQQWLEDNKQKLDEQGKLPLFDHKSYQFQIFVYGGGKNEDQAPNSEAWLWQLEGSCSVDVEGEHLDLEKDGSLLIPEGKRFTVEQSAGARTLVCYQDQTKATTWPKS